jgi:hypothetical protein
MRCEINILNDLQVIAKEWVFSIFRKNWSRGFCRFFRLRSSHFRYYMVKLVLPAGKEGQEKVALRSCTEKSNFGIDL